MESQKRQKTVFLLPSLGTYLSHTHCVCRTHTVPSQFVLWWEETQTRKSKLSSEALGQVPGWISNCGTGKYAIAQMGESDNWYLVKYPF